MANNKRNRRSRRQLLEDKLQEQNKRIEFLEEQLKCLKQKKAETQRELKEVILAEEKAKKEAEEKALLKFIEEHNITREDLERLIK